MEETAAAATTEAAEAEMAAAGVKNILLTSVFDLLLL